MPDPPRARLVEAVEDVVRGGDIEEHEAREERRVVEREAVSDARATVVADEDDRRQAERLDHLREVGRHPALVVAAGRAVGVAVAAQVGSEDGEALGQRRHHLPPHVAGLRRAVEQHHAGPRAHPPVVDAHTAFDRHHVPRHGPKCILLPIPVKDGATIP